MIVVVGGTGYIGQAFVRWFRKRRVAHVVLSRREMNYYDLGVLRDWLEKHRPEFLINTAGFTGQPNVDACEQHKTECLTANAVLPGIIRQACEPLGIAWGHVSTGCIYQGARADGSGFRESDPPNFTFRQNNCSFYSGSKALGEEVLDGAAGCYVWRTRMPFSSLGSPRNYLTKLLTYERLLDVRNSLASLEEFVPACFHCWKSGADFGTYHMTNTESITTREVVEMIRRSGLSTRDFRYFESEDEFMCEAALAPRSHCVLDNSKALAAGLPLSDVRTALVHALDHYR